MQTENGHRAWEPRRDRRPTGLHHPVMEVALAAAEQAAQVVHRYFYQKVGVQEKGIGELVTTADIEAEKAIVQVIRDSFPGHAVLAEESPPEVSTSEHLWIIDPIDGTNNFAHRIPHFAISIGYSYQGRMELGVLCNPITSDWYVAVREQGAWFNAEICRVSSEVDLHESLLGIGFYYDRGAMMEATLDTIRDLIRFQTHGVRRFGTASLDLAYVGRGLFGAFFEYFLQPWDFAAGRLFVEEAGGRVTACDGQPLPLASSSSLLASNGKLHEGILKLMQPHWLAYLERREQG